MQAILMRGDPVEGFQFIGPFENAGAAIEYAEKIDIEPDWWVIELEAPKSEH